MEDKEGQDENMRNLLSSLGMDKESNKPEDSGVLPEAYKDCDMIYQSEHKSLGLPVILGVMKKENKFLIGFGDDDPFSLDVQELIYMMVSTGALITNVLKDTMGLDMNDLSKKVKDVTKDTRFRKGNIAGPVTDMPGHSGKSEKVDNSEEDEEKSKAIADKLNELQGTLEEVKNMSEQVEEYTKDMSPEDKKEYVKALNKKQEDLLAKKAREFERSLLGSIEEEESITYNYDYFKKIHEQQGQAALKEELAKVPKEERQEIIAKIIGEAKIKQQKPTNNDEKVN